MAGTPKRGNWGPHIRCGVSSLMMGNGSQHKPTGSLEEGGREAGGEQNVWLPIHPLLQTDFPPVTDPAPTQGQPAVS